MKWLVAGVVVIGAWMPAIHSAAAATAVSQAALNRRQLSECMTRQMAASRTISYYEASKLCKEQLKAKGDALSASNEAKPANAR